MKKGESMKYIVLIGDGMADYPIKELDDKTILQAARIPAMDYIAARGKPGLQKLYRMVFLQGAISQICLFSDTIR